MRAAVTEKVTVYQFKRWESVPIKAATVKFRLLYVFVLIHHRSRRLLDFNVTAHTTVAWTMQ